MQHIYLSLNQICVSSRQRLERKRLERKRLERKGLESPVFYGCLTASGLLTQKVLDPVYTYLVSSTCYPIDKHILIPGVKRALESKWQKQKKR